jgi:serine/threonine-protein kinase
LLVALAVAIWGVAACGKKVTVPNVKAQSLDQATKALTDANLKVGQVTDTSGATATAGKVVTESPDAGQTVSAGSTINLGVQRPVSVPNLVESNAVDALVTLQNLGLNGSATKQSTLNPLKAGKVLQQNPPENTSAYRGDTVNLVVASPPDLSLLTNLLTQQPGYKNLSPEHRKLIDELLK